MWKCFENIKKIWEISFSHSIQMTLDHSFYLVDEFICMQIFYGLVDTEQGVSKY